MFLFKHPCCSVHIIEATHYPELDSDVNISQYPVYYDALYYPQYHLNTFASSKGVSAWLHKCFQYYTK